jgi:SNF2 family DNA or RNA helicase
MLTREAANTLAEPPAPRFRTLTSLMPHQVPAVEKLARLTVGGLLMDMGTGKTRCAIDLVVRRAARVSRVLYFCPVNLKRTIHDELHKHLAEPSVYLFDDHTSVRRLPRDRDWYLIGIESLAQSRRVLMAAAHLVDSRAFMIVDESTYIKGHRASRTRWITALGEKCRYRLILTGTILTQGAEDLYAQMRFLSPSILGYASWYSFAANHIEYSDKFLGKILRAHNTALLAAKIAPYCYQVTKEECLDLPDKIYTYRSFTMTAAQRCLYDRAKDEMLAELDRMDAEWWQSAVIYRLFGALQQICAGFWHRIVHDWRTGAVLSDEVMTAPHARLDTLAAAIDAIPPGEKVIVWSKYLRSIDDIVGCLNERYPDAGAESYSGASTTRQRVAALDRWRQQSRFLVATPSTGGHGLTLNEAAYVVHYDNGFKYAERIQSEDRNHRIGQTRKVVYCDIRCAGSIDDRIEAALQRKSSLLAVFREQVEHVRGARTLKQALKEVISDL